MKYIGPKRILHVVGGLNRGGTETWLMHVLRRLDRRRFVFDFLVHTERPCAYDAEARQLGAHIIRCPHASNPVAYARAFRRVLAESGPYDAVHSHVHHFSGLVLRHARRAGVPLRIAHSHNDTSRVGANPLRRAYLRAMLGLIQKESVVGLAASREAAVDLFGREWELDPRFRVLHCGVDMEPFGESLQPPRTRTELRIPENALVIGHAGRFVEQKNHAFLVRVFAEIVKREPRARLLLVGEGVLRESVERQVEAAGLTTRVIFAGSRPDVPRLMREVIDVFVLPSLYEGLGLVGVESQAAGLPLVVSDVVPREVEVVEGLVSRLSLSLEPSEWAAHVVERARARRTVLHPEALRLMKESHFNVEHGVKQLEAIYGD